MSARPGGVADGVCPDEPSPRHWRRRRVLVERALAGRAGGQRALPLSLSQQGIWASCRMAPDTPLYVESWRCRLSGPLDRTAFARAVAEVSVRHEVLRTSFGAVDGEPVQLVSPDAVAVDFRDSAATVDLPPGPLFRMVVTSTSDIEHVAVCTAHHLVFDGLSKEILVHELATLYAAFHNGQESPLPALPYQYGDFVLWQRHRLQGQHLARLLDQWRARLADCPALPARPPGHAADQVVTVLPGRLRDAVRVLARRDRVTPFMVLLAVFYLLLHRHTGRRDHCVGTPMANRGAPDADRLIGHFTTTVVLRAEVPAGGGRHELLNRVRAACLHACDHQELPYDVAIAHLRPRRDPLFQVLFAVEDDSTLDRTAAGLRLSEFQSLPATVTAFELTWMITERAGELQVTARFRTDLCDAATVRGLVAEYSRLLDRFTDGEIS